MNHPQPDGAGPRYFGLYPALVTNLVDPDNLGRIEVKLPWLGTQGEHSGESDVRAWATLLTPYAGDGQGFEFLPEKDTQVVVGFEAGNLRRPYLVGAAWNGREALPVKPAAPNNKRLIKTRSGSKLEFDDRAGAPKITVSTASGHRLVLDDGASSVTLRHANGSTIVINAAGQVSITANATVEVTASCLNVHAAVAVFDGLVQCQTLVASSGVVSPAYTPGAGNVW